MNVFKRIEETQKKMFNDSAIVNYEGSTYIYPYISFRNKEVLDNSVNRYYKGTIKKKMINIYMNDHKVFEMIENMNNKKVLERMKREQERKKSKLYFEVYNDEEKNINIDRQNNVNLANFEQKLENKKYSSQNGYNIMYELMRFLLNRPKILKKKKIKQQNDSFFTHKQDSYKKKLKQLIYNSSFDSQSVIKNFSNTKINIPKPQSIFKKLNTFHKEKDNKYDLIRMKKSKSYTNLKSSSNNYLFESINNDKRRIDFPKDNNQNQNDELEYPLLNENSNNINSSINKEKLNNKNKQNLQNEILNKKIEEQLFKKKLKKMNYFDSLSIDNQDSHRTIFINKKIYTNRREFENMKKRLLRKNDEYKSFNNDLEKSKRSILTNINKIINKGEDISHQISNSYRCENKGSINYDINNLNYLTNKYNIENKKKIKMTKEEKENMIKYNENNIVYGNNSNYSISQTNRHFFGKRRVIDEIDKFKNNFSSEIRKELIHKDRKLVKINLKKIIKKFTPRYKILK